MTKEKMVSFNETVYVGLAPNYDRSVKVVLLLFKFKWFKLNRFRNKNSFKTFKNWKLSLIEILVKMGTTNDRAKVGHSSGTKLLQIERNEGSSKIPQT